MNSYSNRLMALGAAIMVVLGLAGTFNALTLLQYPQHPAGAVVERSLYAFEASPYVKEDLVVFDMDLAYNFTDAFQWNTKVLFVFVKAVYQTEGAAFNEVVVWDDIVTAKDAAELETTRFLVDYPLRDKHMQALKGREVTLELCYRYMPIIGLLPHREVARTSFKVPREYVPRKSARGAATE